jgi:hypothetical protein
MFDDLFASPSLKTLTYTGLTTGAVNEDVALVMGVIGGRGEVTDFIAPGVELSEALEGFAAWD